MTQHKIMRDQLLQWTLGEPLDVPLSALLDHLCHCVSCKEYLRTAEETLADLPTVLPVQEPPEHLRSTVLQAIREVQTPASVRTDGLEATRPAPAQIDAPIHEVSGPQVQSGVQPGVQPGVRPEGRLHHLKLWWKRILSQPFAVGMFVIVLMLGMSSGALLRSLMSKEQDLAALTSQYQEETQWLDVATKIIALGVPPEVRAQLTPTEHEPDALGEAAIYHAYGETYYLLLHVEGLSPQADYEIWLQTGTDRTQIGTLTTSDAGADVWVYRSPEGMIAGRLGVRQVGSSEPSVVVDL